MDTDDRWLITEIGWVPTMDDLLKNRCEMEALLSDLEQRVEAELRRRVSMRDGAHMDGQRLVVEL